MSARVLPALPPTRYNGCRDGSEPLYTPEMMRDFAEASIQLAGGAACFDQRSPAAVRLPAVAPEQFDALLAGLRLLAHELGAGRFNAHHEAAGEAYTNDGEHDGLALGGVQALDKLLIAAARQSIGNAALGGYFTATDFASDPTTISCACESCDWRGVATVLHAIGDCSLTPGDASPAGRCPECDTLAYVVQPSAAELALALGNMTALAA